MTTTDPLTPFQWLQGNAGENESNGRLDDIFSVTFFRGLDPSSVIRRFTRSEDPGQESTFDALDEKVHEFVMKTGGGDGGGQIGVCQAGEWCVVIEPYGWTVTLPEVLPKLSRGCEVLAITSHEYAEDSFEYAIDARTTSALAMTRSSQGSQEPQNHSQKARTRIRPDMIPSGAGPPASFSAYPKQERVTTGRIFSAETRAVTIRRQVRQEENPVGGRRR
jgi:hypothetical protein